jgi:hypothetical protein
MKENLDKEFKDLRWLEKTANLLDSKFRIPGTKFTFGFDPILGLIPILGDVSTFILSAIMITYMTKYGVSKKVLILMVLNIVLDALVGGIPVAGSIFDFVYKANDRNIKLLKEHYQEGRHEGSGTWIILAILFVFMVMFVLLFYGLWKLFSFLLGLF